MEEQRKHIDDLFRERLSDHRETPPPAVWDALEQRLDRDAGRGGRGGTGGRGVYRWLGIGALLVMLSSVGYFFAQNSNRTDLPIAEAHVTTTAPVAPMPVPSAPVAPAIADSAADAEDMENTDNDNAPATTDNNNLNNNISSDNNTSSSEGDNNNNTPNTTNPRSRNNARTRNNTNTTTNNNSNNTNNNRSNTNAQNNRNTTTTAPVTNANTGRNNRNNTSANAPTTGNTTSRNNRTNSTANTNTNPTTPTPPLATVQAPTTNTPATAPVAPTTAPPQMEAPKPKPKPRKNLSTGIAVNDFLDTEPDTDLLPPEAVAETAPQSPNNRAPVPEHLKITRDEDGNNIYTQDTTVTEAPTAGGGGGGGGNNRRRRQREDNNSTAKVEGGVKLGYEIGTQPTSANKFVMAAYVQYNAAPKVSILLQPAFKFGNTNLNTNFGTAQSFYNITNSLFDSSSRIGFGDSLVTPDTIYRSYNYTQTHDSISIVNRLTSKVLWEIELPVMMKYQIARKLSVMGGFSLNLSKMLQIQQQQESFSITRQETTEYGGVTAPAGGAFPPGPAPESFGNLFTYNTPHISTYTPTAAQNAPATMLRVGYMAGFSYQLGSRTMVDLLIQQSLGKPTAIPNAQIRSIYTQPYIRITLGYRLSK